MIVVDASALIELLLLTEVGLSAGDRLFAPGSTLHAPEVLDLEVFQVLRRFEQDGSLSRSRAEQCLLDFSAFVIERYPHELVLDRAWELRRNLTAYDAAYVALAEVLHAPLLTCDSRLARAPHRARVEVLRR